MTYKKSPRHADRDYVIISEGGHIVTISRCVRKGSIRHVENNKQLPENNCNVGKNSTIQLFNMHILHSY